jgi:hypothetical protein
VVVCSVIRVASPDRKVLNDRLQRECQNVVRRDEASVRGAPLALRKNGAGCTLSARDLVQRLCFFSGGTV